MAIWEFAGAVVLPSHPRSKGYRSLSKPIQTDIELSQSSRSTRVPAVPNEHLTTTSSPGLRRGGGATKRTGWGQICKSTKQGLLLLLLTDSGMEAGASTKSGRCKQNGSKLQCQSRSGSYRKSTNLTRRRGQEYMLQTSSHRIGTEQARLAQAVRGIPS